MKTFWKTIQWSSNYLITQKESLAVILRGRIMRDRTFKISPKWMQNNLKSQNQWWKHSWRFWKTLSRIEEALLKTKSSVRKNKLRTGSMLCSLNKCQEEQITCLQIIFNAKKELNDAWKQSSKGLKAIDGTNLKLYFFSKDKW